MYVDVYIVHPESLRMKHARLACALSPRYLRMHINYTHTHLFARVDNTHAHARALTRIVLRIQNVCTRTHASRIACARTRTLSQKAKASRVEVRVLRGRNYAHTQLARCAHSKTFRMYYIYMLCAKCGFGLSEDFTLQNVDLYFAQQSKDCVNNCQIYRVLLRAHMRSAAPHIDLPLLRML